MLWVSCRKMGQYAMRSTRAVIVRPGELQISMLSSGRGEAMAEYISYL